MARPLRIEYEDAYYHIIQRGLERRNIFTQDADKDKFLSYLDFAYTGYKAIIHTYVVMDNHYHIILQTPQANLSKIMHFLNASYAAYFNTINKRVGPVYQGRYKAILVQADEYLHHLSRYIHLNPTRANVAKEPVEYRFSSYKYFISAEKPPRWLDINFILSMFDDNILKAKKLYKQFVIDGIGEEKGIIDKNMITGFVLGNADFLENIKNRFIKDKEDYEVPVLNQLKRIKEPALGHINELVAKKMPNDKKLQRKTALYLSRKFTQKTLKEIADFYGKIKYTGVSQVSRRIENRRRENRQLNNALNAIEKELIVQCKDLTP